MKALCILERMITAQVLEWPHPHIDNDWDNGKMQWREITPLAYRQLRQTTPLLHEAADAFMQAEPVDILPDGDILHVC